MAEMREAPPCRDGAATCEPWERAWPDGVEVKAGTVVTQDGEVVPPDDQRTP